jgi:hypothetical protein
MAYLKICAGKSISKPAQICIPKYLLIMGLILALYLGIKKMINIIDFRFKDKNESDNKIFKIKIS